jgi:hypothetical protein
MARYKVLETYTPDNTDLDRSRRTGEFESESLDLIELAFHARLATYDRILSAEDLPKVRALVEASADQLEDQESQDFSITLFGHNGEWELRVARLD